jgi:predicted anti-sigma-YlaC factor YlaD
VPVIEISCLEVWREISNYVDCDIDPELRSRIEYHVKNCKHCSAILDGASNTVRLLADDKAFELPTGFSQRLQQRIANEIGRKT